MISIFFIVGFIFGNVVGFFVLQKLRKKKQQKMKKQPSQKPKRYRNLVMMSVKDLCDIIEKHDPHQPLVEYQDEIIKKGKIIGQVPENMDGDLLTGELREEGLRIKNINEEIRRKKKKEGENDV